MNISSFIARRIAFNQQKSFSRFIIRLSVAATVISVMVMIVTLSFVNGFQETVSQKVFSFWGHVRIQYRQPMKANIAEEQPIEKNDSLVHNIARFPQVESVHPFATKYAILKTAEDMEGVLLKGLDSTYDFNHLSGFLQQGRWIRFGGPSYSREIVISAYTAKQLQLKVDDRILIYFVRPDGSLRPDKLTVTGIYKTGIEEYDKTFAIGDLRLIQRLNGWEADEIGGYEIFLHDYEQMGAVSGAIYEHVLFPLLWETKTIKEIYPNIFDWLQIQNTNQGILITIMVVIAAINLITCLIILVLERFRMIGILKALGATNWAVQKVFLHHSALITFTGILIGTALGLGLLWVQQQTGFIRLDEDAYYMSTAAVKVKWWQVVAVAAGTMTVSFLVLLIPSLIVRNVQPVKAIHFR
ncbi:FtsX-like permease family protein [Paraflavisolibacter sp. H34]|uniref:ABC transporter permease n=1 Tax=Huijunlia imazamoxiresistens TaxID=3127457 RepID=UPI00301B3E9E